MTAGLVIGLLTIAMATIPRRVSADWCPNATLTRYPQSGYQSDTINEEVTLRNGRDVAVQIYWIHVTFSWDGTQRDFGTMSIPAYSDQTNTRSVMLPSNTGDYTVSTVMSGQATGDWLSSECSWSGSFRVNALPPAPKVIITANPSTGTAPLGVSLTTTVTPGIPPYSYSWILGDGSSGSGESIYHVYSTVGTYTAQVIVTDARSRSDSATATVTVTSPPPDSDSDGISDANDNCPSTYNPSQADSDHDGVGDACEQTIGGGGGGGSNDQSTLVPIIILVVVLAAVAVIVAALMRSRGKGPVAQHYTLPQQQEPQNPPGPQG